MWQNIPTIVKNDFHVEINWQRIAEKEDVNTIHHLSAFCPSCFNVEGVDVRLNGWAWPIRRGTSGVAYTGVSWFHL